MTQDALAGDPTETDRGEILDVLRRYARGIDRMDWELVRSCYHPDATDDHGFYSGDVDGFLQFVDSDESLRGFTATMHVLSNEQVEIQGDVAHSECYCLAHHVAPAGHPWGPALVVIGLRYVDRLERRAGMWRIAHRRCAYEWATNLPDATADVGFPAATIRGRRGPTDVSYER